VAATNWYDLLARVDGEIKPKTDGDPGANAVINKMKAARALDLKIPDDLARVGGDDIELAEFLEVPLTTFHQPAREIGSLGAQILLDRLRGGNEEPRRIVLTPRLIVRRSSGGTR
jgi:LacI family transcriptional regulator